MKLEKMLVWYVIKVLNNITLTFLQKNINNDIIKTFTSLTNLAEFLQKSRSHKTIFIDNVQYNVQYNFEFQ